jgi:ATP-binding cassette subfamily C protein/ATP-binding cassette subfamily C protein LapB
MTVGALIATMALLWRVLSPVQSAFLSIPKLQQTRKGIRQINQLMRLKAERRCTYSGLLSAGEQGRISLNRVSFRYGADRDPVLLGVALDVEPGEMVAIIGHTGSGKTTLLKLIAGMYSPQAGSLSIDDVDVRQINPVDLRRAIAYVPQQTKFFRGSIAQNMRLKNGLATDEELRTAARDAGILDDILRLPMGFDTMIGDTRTDRFPPGFLRTLSMARAFLSPAPILLLDEPGASLDEESDRRFVEQLKRMKGERTIVMVSHRPSHIRLSDKALLLGKGSTQFVGSPDRAIAKLLEDAR